MAAGYVRCVRSLVGFVFIVMVATMLLHWVNQANHTIGRELPAMIRHSQDYFHDHDDHVPEDKVDTLPETVVETFQQIQSVPPVPGSLEHVMQQRDALSKQVNAIMKDYMQYQCQHERISATVSGGWCQQISGAESPTHRTDPILAEALAAFFQGKTVGSFGDGPGEYKRLIDATGLVQRYDAYDAAPFSEETTNHRVKYQDLTLPAYGLPVYDWILSLEVIGHIPSKYERQYVDNMNRHAREGVVLSWAPPQLEGSGYANGRPSTYVIQLFEALGLMLDVTKSNQLRNVTSFSWLKNNIYVFKRPIAIQSEAMNNPMEEVHLL